MFESFEAIGIARGIEQAVDGFGVGALRFGEADDGAVGFGDDRGGVRRVIDELRRLSAELGVEFAGESARRADALGACCCHSGRSSSGSVPKRSKNCGSISLGRARPFRR